MPDNQANKLALIGGRALLRNALCGAAVLAAPPVLAHRAIHLPAPRKGTRIIPAQANGLTPDSPADQSEAFQSLLNIAAEKDAPIFLPAGIYRIGGISLPIRTRLIGVPGATRLTFTGRGHMLRAERADILSIDGILFDGLKLDLPTETPGLITVRTARDLQITRSQFLSSGRHGLDLEGAGGTIDACRFSEADDIAVFSRQSTGLTISNCVVENSGNGGIIVHRFTPGADGSRVINNRILGVQSRNGGTGQWGNGINVFQAHNVTVSGNHIADCAFSSTPSGQMCSRARRRADRC
ncbi:MAG: TIGR03808 family TAT-translocated repetitive protein, partial [Pseudomonadota bacterium]